MIEIMQKENWAGHQKRFRWLLHNILLLKDGEVAVDIGCGSGLYVTIPINLEIKRMKRNMKLEGIDISNESVSYAKKNALEENIDMELFQCKNIYEINKKYNAVICSEVLEHLNDSELEGFCTQLCDIVQSGGLLLITVPNGRGSYEKGVISWSKFQKVINSKFVKKMKNVYYKSCGVKEVPLPMTVSDSPHIQFFSYEVIVKMFEERGMRLAEFTGSNRFYNNFMDAFMPRIEYLMKLNNMLGEKRPLKASGYYFKFIKE